MGILGMQCDRRKSGEKGQYLRSRYQFFQLIPAPLEHLVHWIIPLVFLLFFFFVVLSTTSDNILNYHFFFLSFFILSRHIKKIS